MNKAIYLRTHHFDGEQQRKLDQGFFFFSQN
jgi:hypothetical protein